MIATTTTAAATTRPLVVAPSASPRSGPRPSRRAAPSTPRRAALLVQAPRPRPPPRPAAAPRRRACRPTCPPRAAGSRRRCRRGTRPRTGVSEWRNYTTRRARASSSCALLVALVVLWRRRRRTFVMRARARFCEHSVAVRAPALFLRPDVFQRCHSGPSRLIRIEIGRTSRPSTLRAPLASRPLSTASGCKTLANARLSADQRLCGGGSLFFPRTSLHDLCDESPGAGRGPARPRAKTRRLSRG